MASPMASPFTPSAPSSPHANRPPSTRAKVHRNASNIFNIDPAPPSSPQSPSSSPRPKTFSDVQSARKSATLSHIESASSRAKPSSSNAPSSPVSTFNPERIRAALESCRLKKEQFGWCPAKDIDPAYDHDKSKPSFALWWEGKPDHNPAGVNKFLQTSQGDGVLAEDGAVPSSSSSPPPRLYNYLKRDSLRSQASRPDTTRGGLEGRSYQIPHPSAGSSHDAVSLKVTQTPCVVGLPGWLDHVPRGNGVVRWTDGVIDFQQESMGGSKSVELAPGELAPLYSSFSVDKVFRWKPPPKHGAKRSKGPRRVSLDEILAAANMRREKFERLHSEKEGKESKEGGSPREGEGKVAGERTAEQEKGSAIITGGDGKSANAFKESSQPAAVEAAAAATATEATADIAVQDQVASLSPRQFRIPPHTRIIFSRDEAEEDEERGEGDGEISSPAPAAASVAALCDGQQAEGAPEDEGEEGDGRGGEGDEEQPQLDEETTGVREKGGTNDNSVRFVYGPPKTIYYTPGK